MPSLDYYLGANTCYARVDAGVDVFTTDDRMHIAPRVGFGVGMRFPVAAVTLETVAVRDDGTTMATVAASLRFWYPRSAAFQQVSPGLTVIVPVAGDTGVLIGADVHFTFGNVIADHTPR
jgi:hypothetical protein